MIKIDEKTFEELLYDALQTESGTANLHERGLSIRYLDNKMLFRQFNTKNYGIMDIMRISFSLGYVYVDIIELKVVDFDISHLTQLGRYICFIQQLLKANNIRNRIYIRGILIVADFDPEKDHVWMDSIVAHYIHVYKTIYTIDGLRFQQVMPIGWHQKNTNTKIDSFFDFNELKQRFKQCYKETQDQPF